MQNSIDEIKRKLDIVEFIGARMALKKAGRNFNGLCPFHNEKSPSFVVSPDRQIWHCFGACQDGGDVIKFLMKWDNITFYEALSELAEKTGVRLQKTSFEDQAWKQKEHFFKMNKLAAQFYHYLLVKHKVGQTGREYLEQRNISQKLIETFNLGYAPASWDSLAKFMKSKKYTNDDLIKAGLLIKSDGGRTYDRFRGRLIFPLTDSRANILGFSGRVLIDSKQAKYINSPETPIYRKRETLFGIHLTKEHIKKENCAVVVEGEFDMISLFKEGISNVVAVKGSAVTHEQLQILGRITKHVTLALDSDFAGGETAKRAIAEAEKMDFNIDVAVYDFGKDPDEAIKNDSAGFKKIIKKPQPVYDFIIDKAVKKYSKNDVFSKKEVASEVIPFISSIQNPIVKSHYIKKISTILEVEADSVMSLASNYEKSEQAKQNKQFTAVQKPQKKRDELVEEYILSYLLKQKNPHEILQKTNNILDESDFDALPYKKIFQSLLKQNDGQFDIYTFVESLDPTLKDTCDTLFLSDVNVYDDFIEVEFEKTIYELKKISLKKQITKYLSTMDEEGNDKISQLTKMLTQVEKKLVVM